MFIENFAKHKVSAIVFLAAASFFFKGCGDDGGSVDPGIDAQVSDASHIDSSLQIDAGTDPLSDAEVDSGVDRDPAEPLFEQAASYEITIEGPDDPATVYYPNPPDLHSGGYSFPIALFLQGAKVERKYYSEFASLLARYGFVVVVPDHMKTGLMGTDLYPETQQIEQVLEQMIEENGGSTTLAGLLDTDTMVVLGHSYGGVAGLYGIQDECNFAFCSGGFSRPAALSGGAFFGTNMKPPIGSIPEVKNDSLPVAYIQGTLDGKADLEDTRETYQKTQDPPKMLVELIGANHYGICNQNNPPGADADSNAPTIDQTVAIETTARWSALFLRATVLDDLDALDYISSTGQTSDNNVSITWQP